MRIGIVNDLPMAAEALRRAVRLVPENQVVWIASNGAEAVDLCAKDTPDLVLMDLIMPLMDGVEATKRIMATTPCAILIVTVSVEANVSYVFEALGHGAVDALDTPALGAEGFVAGAEQLLAKIRTIGKLVGEETPARDGHKRKAPLHGSHHSLIAIGASAGGPAALATVLSDLPRNFSVPIVIVQHVDPRFLPSMVEWLNRESVLPVRLAEEGDDIKPGTVLLAGRGDHLELKATGRLGYTPDPQDYAYRPSIDVFFQSVTDHWSGEVVGVLLTGMGRDGAAGLAALRAKGHHTIAQDEATSAVYGMPKAAAAIRAAVEILPLKTIAPRLVELFALPRQEENFQWTYPN